MLLLLRRVLSLFAAALVGLAAAVVGGSGPALAAPGPTFTNPVVDVPNSADPTLTYYNGFYYYVATTWNSNVVMRRSATIAGLRVAPEQVVVQTGGTTMWAPHLEMINNRWYLYYSIEQSGGARRTHVAESSGTDPLGPYTIRGILNLMPSNGWAIDAAPLKLNNALYMTFSAFHGDGLQSLFIAPMANPYTASAFGSRISAPTLAWETQNGAVNEGSFALQRNGRTFLTYSASHCQGPNYKLGMLEYTGSNPLAQSSWTKFASPIFQRNDAAGVYGPGHHSFFSSPDGTETWIAYHANSSASQGCGTTRTTRVQKISWNADGTPNLGVPVATSTVLAGPSGETATPVEIRNQHSNLCLDDYNWVTTPGAEVRQWTCGTATVQDWYLTPATDGYVTISNRNSGLCLDDKDWATAAGAVVQQWTCNGLSVQQWKVTAAGDGYSTLQNRYSGLCLDNFNFGTTPGAEVRQWTCTGNNAQRWRIV
ncbi:GH43 family beta-xylosidase [Actinoplanes lutulentus]|uniref:GH43 family beta-xylosidase n=1 Tax=Actinoplanes lutulentus TaxID=1287878 RepID=A0A327ZCL6_9ACTN|nr:family 43 glycosylhydrolase [Actinoplanes lutulentus]MBB2947099.1 GH43 family beta-xylosidase [Actinoplanes lutulentus]RAK30596.1 GH43 family beta-xylosidase [Actinoplanes lutulentus]